MTEDAPTPARSGSLRRFRSTTQAAADGSRTILLNDHNANADAGYVDNSLKSAKYTPLNLVPKALYEQFKRIANFYFLIVAAVSFIPGISPTTPIANVLPLLVVVGFGFARDVYEDIMRSRADAKTNATPQVILSRDGGSLVKDDGRAVDSSDGVTNKGKPGVAAKLVRWNLPLEQHRVVRSRDIAVGDIVFVGKGESIPADLVLVHSANEGGVAYVSTASLDGESSLKRLIVAGKLSDMAEGPDDLRALKGWVKAGEPAISLHHFEGSIGAAVGSGVASDAAPLDANNLLLRGSILRNTEYVYGLAVYTGSESKVSLNMRHPPSKMGNTEKKLNWVVLLLFLNLLILVVAASVVGAILQGRSGVGQWYMGSFRFNGTGTTLAKNLGTFLVLFSTYIPVSLFVTLEFVRVIQAVFMTIDIKMKTKGQAVAVKATNLNEVLGQVQFILSDKTGTLTENVMRYIACSAGGNVYDVSKKKRVMERAIEAGDQPVKELVLAMALCHSVVPEPVDEEEIGEAGEAAGGEALLPEYQGQSPDEVALVSSAREYGVALVDRTLDTFVIDHYGVRETYEGLAELEFNSDRKRMSMVLRCPDGSVKMITKGADTIMMPLLKPSSENDVAQDHIDLFAKEGLRTLVYASKTIPENEFQEWFADFTAARNLLTDRERAVSEVSARLETNLDFVAVTAVEDKLQDRVPETIKFMREAGVGLWVLTGDKRETAENIGYSANLLDRAMNVVHVDADSPEELARQLDDAKARYTGPNPLYLSEKRDALASAGSGESLSPTPRGHRRRKSRPEFALATRLSMDSDGRLSNAGSDSAFVKRRSSLGSSFRGMASRLSPRRKSSATPAEVAVIIDGASLAHAIESHPEKFMDLADRCKTVICCRVTPLQKALVVRLVREMRKAMTLAIGDGGNDVSMIQEAHVGVGLFGKEGTQAARAGDYAMSEFKHLQRLMSIHGRYSYVRTAGVINLSFYKNILFTMTQVFFQIFCFVTGTTFQDQWIVSSFNVVVTALSPFLHGLFERDLEEDTVTRFPQVYASNRNDRLFSIKSVAEYTVLYGVWHCVCVFFGVYFGYGYLTIPFRNGQDGGLYMTALGSALIIVIIALGKFILHSHILNWIVILALVLSFGIFFAVIPLAIYVALEYPLEGVIQMVLSSTQFYLSAALIIAASYWVDLTVLIVRQLMYPDVVNTLQLWEKRTRRQRKDQRIPDEEGDAVAM